MTENNETTIARIKEVSGIDLKGPIRIVTDTSNWTDIGRGNILRFDGRDFVIRGNTYEQRYGISDQPKYWVFNAYDLQDGGRKIIKMVFHEEFHVHIGVFKIHCYRSPEKEGDVLDLVRGDNRYMQGFTKLDDKNNHVRIIDFIYGTNLFKYIIELNKKHEEYFHNELPEILWRLSDSLEAIRKLHKNNFCHGDIRNDHILIDRDTGLYRWIDFDLKQNVSDFDIWSLGNIINYAVGMGIVSINRATKNKSFSEEARKSLTQDDASGFYCYRLMDLQKVFPYIPERLANILRHFTVKPEKFYTNIDELIDEYYNMLETEFASGKPKDFKLHDGGAK